ncbi:MAG TPA: hypothetical protein VHM20_04985, partial [Gammaproteobacteria bacterium]|nr:hypothetical protein [Gammaproteobacteria bacterium]
MLRQPLSPVLEHKNSNSRFEDVPPPLENGIDRIASFDRPPPLELIFDEKKSIEEKKDHPNPGEGRCYSLAMTGLSAHGALAIGIGGFTALTTLMEYISEKSQTGEKPEPWGFQFILTMGIAIIGGLILSIATYRGRSTNRQEREEKLNHLICNAEKISEEAHQLAKQTISRRKKVKNMLKMTYAGQKSLYDFFKISQEFKTPREVPYLTHKKKEGKQNNSFHCSFRKTGNVFLHFLAGSVNLITH